MERVDKEGMVATAETTAKIISSCIPKTQEGSPILSIFDIHAVIERFYFTDNVVVSLQSNIESLLSELKLKNPNYAIAFPDQGAYKRFIHQLDENTPIIVCAKFRDQDKRIVKILEKINWRDGIEEVVIVDDLVQSGGTLHECRVALSEQGFKRISAYVTHAVFPNDCYKRFLKGGDREGFETFYISDSIPEVVSKLEGLHPFKVLSIAGVINTILMNKYSKKNNIDDLFYMIFLSSENQDKKDAVRMALSRNFGKYTNLFDRKTESGVSNQPIGFDETFKGALNRTDRATGDARSMYIWENLSEKVRGQIIYEKLEEDRIIKKKIMKYYENLMNYFEKCNDGKATILVVSIENGVCQQIDGKWVDFAVVYVRLYNPTTDEKVDHWEVSEMVPLPEGIVPTSEETAGSLMNKKFGWDASNWHIHVCGKSRSYIIMETLDKIFKNMKICIKRKNCYE